jgi:hypothetical protein
VAAVVVRVLVTTVSVAAFTALGRTLGVFSPVERPAEAHQRRHRDHLSQAIERVVVCVAQPASELRAELLTAALTPRVSSLCVAVVLLRSWHQVHHLLSFCSRFRS